MHCMTTGEQSVYIQQRALMVKWEKMDDCKGLGFQGFKLVVGNAIVEDSNETSQISAGKQTT